MEKFKSQLVTDNSSVCSDPSPKTSLSSHHRITPSNLTVGEHLAHTGVVTGAGGKRVTTAAIVTHEMDSASTLVRKSSRASLSKSSNSQEWRAVKWKDREEVASASEAASNALTASPPASAVTAGTPLREVNASLARLDRKIMHLETLLAKLTDRLSQHQGSNSMDSSNEVHPTQHSQASSN